MSMLSKLLGLVSADMAIDLGTANTLIIYNDKVVVDEALCKSCTVCIQVCPNKAIGVKKGD